jgi:hypothetical protein
MSYPVDDPETWPFAFEAGDRVTDNDEFGTRKPLRVLEVLEEPAADHDIPAVGETVAALNPDHPAAAPVVAAVFETNLESTITPWRDALDDPDAEHFGAAVESFCEEWGVSIKSYHYPATRLVPYAECDSCEGGKGYAHEPEISGFTGYLCLNDECPVDS